MVDEVIGEVPRFLKEHHPLYATHFPEKMKTSAPELDVVDLEALVNHGTLSPFVERRQIARCTSLVELENLFPRCHDARLLRKKLGVPMVVLFVIGWPLCPSYPDGWKECDDLSNWLWQFHKIKGVRIPLPPHDIYLRRIHPTAQPRIKVLRQLLEVDASQPFRFPQPVAPSEAKLCAFLMEIGEGVVSQKLKKRRITKNDRNFNFFRQSKIGHGGKFGQEHLLVQGRSRPGLCARQSKKKAKKAEH